MRPRVLLAPDGDVGAGGATAAVPSPVAPAAAPLAPPVAATLAPTAPLLAFPAEVAAGAKPAGPTLDDILKALPDMPAPAAPLVAASAAAPAQSAAAPVDVAALAAQVAVLLRAERPAPSAEPSELATLPDAADGEGADPALIAISRLGEAMKKGLAEVRTRQDAQERFAAQREETGHLQSIPRLVAAATEAVGLPEQSRAAIAVSVTREIVRAYKSGETITQATIAEAVRDRLSVSKGLVTATRAQLEAQRARGEGYEVPTIPGAGADMGTAADALWQDALQRHAPDGRMTDERLAAIKRDLRDKGIPVQ